MEYAWCTYGGIDDAHPNYVGKIAKDLGSSVYIIASENQGISDLWDGAYVKRFSDLDEAIAYYIENRPPPVDGRSKQFSDKRFRKHMRICYPTYYKKKSQKQNSE